MIVTVKILLFAALCWMVYSSMTDPIYLKYEPGITPDKVVCVIVTLVGGGFFIFTWRKK